MCDPPWSGIGNADSRLAPVVIGHFDVGRSFGRPLEANPELVVDPDRMLSLAVAAKRFKPVAGRQPKVAQIDGGIEIAKFPARDLDQIRREALRALAVENDFGGPIPEGLDHGSMYH